MSGGAIDSLPELMSLVDGRPDALRRMLGDELNAEDVDKVYRHISQLPMLETRLKITGMLMQILYEDVLLLLSSTYVYMSPFLLLFKKSRYL